MSAADDEVRSAAANRSTSVRAQRTCCFCLLPSRSVLSILTFLNEKGKAQWHVYGSPLWSPFVA